MSAFRRSGKWFTATSIAGVALASSGVAYGGMMFAVEGSPNDGTQHNTLRAISVSSGPTAFAVGEYREDGVYAWNTSRTLVLRWTGSSWGQMNSANWGTASNELRGVSVVSPTSVFAVGRYYSGASYHTLAEYYDGTKWRGTYTPTITPHDNVLTAVAASSATNAWAVGDYFNGTVRSHRTMIQHFNGTSWRIVKSPNIGGGNNLLTAVSVVPGTSGTEAWAVGSYAAAGTTRTLVVHLSGGTWHVVASPNFGLLGSSFKGVAAASRSAVYAVGSSVAQIGASLVQRTLVERWNGSSWRIVTSNNRGWTDNVLTAVSAPSARSVVAVGRYFASPRNQSLALVLRRGSFVLVASGNVSGGNNVLLGAASALGQPTWAVGTYYSGSADRTLVERLCTTC